MRLLKPNTIAASARAARLQQPRLLHAQTRRVSHQPEREERPQGLPELPRPRQQRGTNTAPYGIGFLLFSIISAYWATTTQIEAFEAQGKPPPTPPNPKVNQ
ncbi:hypothetical protein C8A05DRAFT_37720 [Staphylotrichum tortipilum]|uniref:Uncharacterized protein n=1 Tax=Staphylotrichum tortipilum TaxID=2831512 RepID=A0AAN6MEX0_9PEZI|nr:hypothetical protein C8A05DRAFT_37720 [Staphylotrichum longicolle]